MSNKNCYELMTASKNAKLKARKLGGGIEKLTVKSSQSNGLVCDLDKVVNVTSKLSMDKENLKTFAKTLGNWESADDDKNTTDEIRMGREVGTRKGKELNFKEDLKPKAFLKTFHGIHLLIPLSGFEVEEEMGQPTRKNLFVCDENENEKVDQLEKIITIDTFAVKLEEYFLNMGLRIIQASPIISIQPFDIKVKFSHLYPAIVQIPLNLEPSDEGDQVHCLYSRSALPSNGVETNFENIHWSSEFDSKFWMSDDDFGKVNLETIQFGLFVLVIRPSCPYSTSTTSNISAQTGGKLVLSQFPNVEVDFPKKFSTKQDDILKVKAKIYLDSEKSVTEFISSRFGKLDVDDDFKSNCLATPIIQLEPHGIQFDGEFPVLVTLPVPHFDKIQALLGNKAKLSIWQSSTHSGEPSKWEKLEVDYEIRETIRENGDDDDETVSVVTFPVKHFSFFKGVWEEISNCLSEAKLGMMYYFGTCVFMKCQANMQEYPDQLPTTTSDDIEDDSDGKNKGDVGGSRRFGLEVIIFQANKPCPQITTYKNKVGQSHPKLVKRGKICVRLKSHYFLPDVQAGEGEEMVKVESDFRGIDFEKQFICKFKDDIKSERGPFGKVLVSWEPLSSSDQIPQPIFEFNIQMATEDEITTSTTTNKQSDDEWSIIALKELASSLLGGTRGDNWKIFAQEIMTQQEIKDSGLQFDRNPFDMIVSHYRQRGGTPQELVGALYRCHRTLTLSSTQSSHKVEPSRKRLMNNYQIGESGLSIHTIAFGKLVKRKRMSLQEPGPSSSGCVQLSDSDEDSDTDSDGDNILWSNFQVCSVGNEVLRV